MQGSRGGSHEHTKRIKWPSICLLLSKKTDSFIYFTVPRSKQNSSLSMNMSSTVAFWSESVLLLVAFDLLMYSLSSYMPTVFRSAPPFEKGHGKSFPPKRHSRNHKHCRFPTKKDIDRGLKFHQHRHYKKCYVYTNLYIQHVCEGHLPGVDLPGSQWGCRTMNLFFARSFEKIGSRIIEKILTLTYAHASCHNRRLGAATM